MIFEMNGRLWKIIEVDQKRFWEDDGKAEEINNSEYYFGRTKYVTQEIWICNELSKEQKRKTLYHELMHCYRGSYFSFTEINNQDEDVWCDISANSHDIIHKIVEDYFKEEK